ncbi:MAG: GxxExxY protein [Ignavibacterium sp.]|nr:GxxExxY protein [Ignavibacterium sp.]MDW8375410.1 GxxExxY protein [Ignavibacteriales bacterium]
MYKDALEYEFNLNNIPYEREKEFMIKYKNHILPHRYFADFVVFNKIILEVKASTSIIDEYIKQTLNYLAVSKCKLGLIVNFGEDSLKYKRVVL